MRLAPSAEVSSNSCFEREILESMLNSFSTQLTTLIKTLLISTASAAKNSDIIKEN
jgi:hypothetical protein